MACGKSTVVPRAPNLLRTLTTGWTQQARSTSEKETARLAFKNSGEKLLWERRFARRGEAV